ncbi:hypothetical protein [Christiangramia sp. SM2212]|uniref:Uncharacterized protein n=1 Tax=Christiangramia sediminicola TaxID=3073267 RepID=A0ABU1ETC5_9FLAO|nr:hypothetical protein [Christiangramia sp. SM2212]MDR5591641.1 hypothetical protein [Christiangramia sp. SM2212]
MIYLNYSDLNEEAQNRLLKNSKRDVGQKFGNDIRRYAKEHCLNFKTMLEEEAMRNLYSYNYVFNI